MTQTTTPAKHLRVGGLTPLTSIDFPGELAAVVYCQGCPWRCRHCHNGHLLAAEPELPIPWNAVKALLDRRRGLLDAVVFTGGEPTAQAALPAAMAECRAMGYNVGLHTGGPYPQRLLALLPLIDWIGLDIKALPEDYPLITGVPGSGDKAWQTLRLLLDAEIPLEVRTTPMPGLDDHDYLSRLMHRLAAAGVTNYALQQCQTQHALDPTLPEAQTIRPADWIDQPFAHFVARAS